LSYFQDNFEIKIQTRAEWLYEFEHLIVFTGAGIITESGLSDFGGPNSLWTRRDNGLAPKLSNHCLDSFEPN